MNFKKRDLILPAIPLILSLLFIVLVPRNPYTSDGNEYDVMAKNILQGRGYSVDGVNPYGLRPPLYPLFVAFFYLIFGATPYPIIIAQVIL
ncbi:MAG: hypothetical protein ACPLYC_01775, partial [Minisyncoccia bacterium]